MALASIYRSKCYLYAAELKNTQKDYKKKKVIDEELAE